MLRLTLNSMFGRRKSEKSKRIRGRGESSGAGKTAGRGMKGAKSRAGYSRKIGHAGGSAPLHLIMPVKRGNGKNSCRSDKLATLSFRMLNNLFQNDANDMVVDMKSIVLRGGGRFRKGYKIVAGEELKIKLASVEAQKFSEAAKQQLEEQGIRANVIPGHIVFSSE